MGVLRVGKKSWQILCTTLINHSVGHRSSPRIRRPSGLSGHDGTSSWPGTLSGTGRPKSVWSPSRHCTIRLRRSASRPPHLSPSALPSLLGTELGQNTRSPVSWPSSVAGHIVKNWASRGLEEVLYTWPCGANESQIKRSPAFPAIGVGLSIPCSIGTPLLNPNSKLPFREACQAS